MLLEVAHDMRSQCRLSHVATLHIELTPQSRIDMCGHGQDAGYEHEEAEYSQDKGEYGRYQGVGDPAKHRRTVAVGYTVGATRWVGRGK